MTPPETPKPSPFADDEPEPTPEELAAAQALARALDAGGPHPDAAFVEALRAATAPSALAPERHEELLVRALAEARPRGQVLSLSSRRWAALAVFAAAACLLLVLGRSLRRPPTVTLTASRSTQELFTQDEFPREGGERARVDRIADRRAQELRANRFAQWGVR